MRQPLRTISLIGFLLALLAAAAHLPAAEKSYTLSGEIAAKITAAAPAAPIAAPQQPRRVLVYGRMPTHPESVVCCFHALGAIAERSGAFKVVCSGDPAVFLPESLAQFDAVVMNNTHERYPMRPADFDSLDGETQKKLEARETLLQKSLMDFVKGGKGIVGIHGAVAGGVRWPEYLEMLNGSYGGHFTDTVAVAPVMADHPICKPLAGKTFEVYDEIYMFKEPYDPKKVQILMSLDLAKMKDPGKRPGGDYPVSWIRSYGKGRVFYCSLGHCAGVYATPEVMQHYLAGIQWAIGDLKE